MIDRSTNPEEKALFAEYATRAFALAMEAYQRGEAMRTAMGYTAAMHVVEEALRAVASYFHLQTMMNTPDDALARQLGVSPDDITSGRVAIPVIVHPDWAFYSGLLAGMTVADSALQERGQPIDPVPSSVRAARHVATLRPGNVPKFVQAIIDSADDTQSRRDLMHAEAVGRA